MDRHAGSRFRRAQRIALGTGLCISVGAHALLLARGRLPPIGPLRIDVAPQGFVTVGYPPVTEIPPPPEPIRRPSEPPAPEVEVRALDLDPSVDATPVEVATPPDLPLPAPERWSFVRSQVPPLLETSTRFARRLERFYPRALRAAEVEGVVDLDLFVDREGRVSRARVRESSGHEELDEAAEAMAAEMQFLPALQRDRIVGVWISQRICFALLEGRRQRLASDACERIALRRH